MRNPLRAPFSKSIELASDTIEGIAEGIDRSPRLLRFYVRGQRRVTADAARALAAYLRKRARALNDAADRLNDAADREEEKNR